MKAGSRRANALLQLTSSNNGAGSNDNVRQQQPPSAKHEGVGGKRTHLHRTGSWPPLPPPPPILFVGDEREKQEQYKENRFMTTASSSSSSHELDCLNEQQQQQPTITIPPPSWALPDVPSSSSAQSTTSVETEATHGQITAISESKCILRSASLTSILDELNEKAVNERNERGLGIGDKLVDMGSSSSSCIGVNGDISSIMVGEAGSAHPSPVGLDEAPEINDAKTFNPTTLPSRGLVHKSSSSTSSFTSSSTLATVSGSRSELCFGCLDGRVTSIVATSDGAFVICGFSSGAVRLYDMTLNGNTDPEDRVGYLLTRHDSAQGFLQMHLEIGGTSIDGVRCSHLFCGSKIGSTRMTVIDMEAIRGKKQKRGFITTAGLQTMTYSDGRLRGFTSLATMYCEVTNKGNNTYNTDYAVKYRILTGLGYGNYNVWDMLIERKIRPDGSVESHDFWSIAANGSVNGPTMTFGCIVTADPKALLKLWRRSNDECIHENTDESDNTFEILFQSREKDLRVQRLDMLMAGKSSVVRGMKNTLNKVVHASSSDGSVLFSGIDELVVHRYLPSRASVGGGSVVSTATYNLDPFSNEKNFVGALGNNIPKRQRRMRQIESIRCTMDGNHALVLCTDNSVLVYSSVDQLLDSHWRKASSVDRDEPLESLTEGFISEGALRYLYTVDISFKVDVAIFTDSHADQHQEFLKHVFICISWWLSSAPSDGGCMSVTNLDAAIAGAIPLAAIHPKTDRHGCCWQCGMRGLNHWEAIGMQPTKEPREKEIKMRPAKTLSCKTDDIQPDVIKNSVNKTSRKKMASATFARPDVSSHDISEHRSNHRSSNANGRVAAADSHVGVATTTPTVMDQQDQVQLLMVQLQESRDEIELVVRKADRRFEEEKRLRKAWNVERKELQDEIMRLDSSNKEALNSLYTSQMEVARMRKVVAKYNKHLLGFLQGMGLSKGALPFDMEPDSDGIATSDFSDHVNSSTINVSSTSPSSSTNDLSGTPIIKAPFCVICQANTADVMIVDCGHICICHEHSLTMQNTGQLKSCPVCKKDVQAVCKVRGLEPR